jgi:hypothetical protein
VSPCTMACEEGSLVIEVVSATGIQRDNHTFQRNLRLHIIYNNEITDQSRDVAFTSDSEVSFNHTSRFPLKDDSLAKIKSLNCPVYLYISQSLSYAASAEISPHLLPPDHQPVGTGFTRTFVAQAVIGAS